MGLSPWLPRSRIVLPAPSDAVDVHGHRVTSRPDRPRPEGSTYHTTLDAASANSRDVAEHVVNVHLALD